VNEINLININSKRGKLFLQPKFGLISIFKIWLISRLDSNRFKPSCHILFSYAFSELWYIFEELFTVDQAKISPSKMHRNMKNASILVSISSTFYASFFLLIFWRQKIPNSKHSFVIFGAKLLCKKSWCKLLMKLTPERRLNQRRVSNKFKRTLPHIDILHNTCILKCKLFL